MWRKATKSCSAADVDTLMCLVGDLQDHGPNRSHPRPKPPAPRGRSAHNRRTGRTAANCGPSILAKHENPSLTGNVRGDCIVHFCPPSGENTHAATEGQPIVARPCTNLASLEIIVQQLSRQFDEFPTLAQSVPRLRIAVFARRNHNKKGRS